MSLLARYQRSLKSVPSGVGVVTAGKAPGNDVTPPKALQNKQQLLLPGTGLRGLFGIPMERLESPHDDNPYRCLGMEIQQHAAVTFLFR